MNFEFFFYLLLLSLFGFTQTNRAQSGYDLTNQMIATAKRVQTMEFTLKTFERIEGKMIEQKMYVKWMREPFKIYVKQAYPNEGVEILYVSGANKDKALVAPNSFPWFNLKLDPYGDLMRADQHHTIFGIGFDKTVSILESLLKKYGTQAASMVKNYVTVEWKGIECYKIFMMNPNFKYIDYTIKEGETLLTIAKKFKLSEHMILEKNEKVDNYDDVDQGQVIKIPNDYAKKMTIYIDKQKMIPVVIKVYDDQGLYEQYEHSRLEINPVFDSDEFSEDYEEYGF
ncbi:MAG: DUF1571 domain-containing protein [Cytophagales bacterium]|nr:DUF1571 domain-containing protein [Cytophagales bacterium]